MKVVNVDIIKEVEKLRLKAYLPTKNDVWTIGYGHTDGVVEGQEISEAKALEFLKEDLDEVEKGILRYVRVPLTQNQYDALCSLIFNIGLGNFAKSTVLKLLNKKDYLGAANAFLMWTKQKNRRTGVFEVLDGLVIRRKKERNLFLNG